MLKRNTWVYYWTQFLHSLIFTAPIWIIYYQTRITVSQLAFLVTLQYIIQMILELPSGALADLVGRKWAIFCGYLLGALAYSLLPFAQVFWHFLVLIILMGAADSFRSGSEEALLYDTYKEHKNENGYDVINANGNIIYQFGLIISATVGGFMYDFRYYLPFILEGITLFTGSIAVVMYIEPHIDSEKFSLSNYMRQVRSGAAEAFRTEYSKYISLFYIFVGGIAWSSTLYFNEYLMIDLGFGNADRGYLTAGMRLVNVLIITKILKNTRLFSFRRTILFFPLMMLSAYLPGIILKGYAGLPFIQAAMIATTARWIILTPLTNAVFASKYRATAISFLSLLIGFVYIAMTAISGPIIAALGMKVMYSVLGLVTLFSVVPIAYKLLKIRPATAPDR